MSPRSQRRVGSAAVLVALLLLVPPAHAAEQCGPPGLTLEDLNTLARGVALADRVAPHSLYLRDETLRSAFVSLRERTAPMAVTNATADEERWQPGFGLPSLHEYPGAAIEFRGELVVAGWLRTAGSKPVNGIARWTDRGWEPLGEGIVPGFSLAILDDRLYAGEWVGTVAVWDGQSWTRLPASPLNSLRALLVHDGELYAAGTFGSNGRVARFDGQAWHVLGGDFDDEVAALGFFRGDLIAGGRFRHYQGAPCGYVARWSGTTWEPIGSGIDQNEYMGVSAIEEYGDRLVVGGWFSSCGFVPSPGLAAWDGSAWSALAGAPAAYVNDLMVMDGKLYVAGAFAGDYASVAQWDGATWTSHGLEQWALGLASYHGQLTAVGGFYGAGCPSNKRITGVATLGKDGWNGFEQWEPTMHGLVHNAGAADVSSAVLYDGRLVVGGIMGLAGSPPEWKAVMSPVQWDGDAWQPVGIGSPCAQKLAVVGDDLIGGSYFGGIARWDGAAWHSMGSGLSGMILAITEFQGNIYVGGELRIGATGESTTLASFDGTEWSTVPSAPSVAQWNTPRVAALEAMGNLLYVGGNFEGAGSIHSPSIVAWDGMRWRGVGRGLIGDIGDLEIFQGELYAGGTISPGPNAYDYEGVMRWDGSAWNRMGLERCQVLALGRYGDKLVIAGNAGVDRFVPGSMGLVSWDGEQWGGFGSGVNGQVRAIQQVEGDLYVAGTFSSAGDQSSFSIARWSGSEPLPTPPTLDPPVVELGFGVASAVVTSNEALLSFSMPEAGHACLELYDVRGARVATLRDGDADSGKNQFEWSSGSPVPFPRNGIYFLRLTAGGRSAKAKVVFAR